jgi:hypothetical protein
MASGGVFTSVRSPFGDSRENIGDEHEMTNSGGIKVHKTVEISRFEESEQDSEQNEPWPVHDEGKDKYTV